MSYNSKYKGAEVESLLDKVNDMGEIPTKVSQLENDVPYVTEDAVHNGVYAVDTNGNLIDYNTADSSCLGVALVAGEHKFMIAKNNATDGSNTTLYWTKSYSDLSLTNYNKVDGTNSFGYLPKQDGTFGGPTHLSNDFTTWKAGALSDFNGKANTAVIAEASSHAKDMCTVLNTFNASDSFKDWYVPACGQLALMYLNMTEINAALVKIGGTALAAEGYWSGSELSSSRAWYVGFSNGYVGNNYKDGDYRVRFVRDISSKSLKERVAELESSKQDMIEDLDDIRDGASKGATALQEEQYKGTVTSVTAGEGLEGGTITGSGTISLAKKTQNYINIDLMSNVDILKIGNTSSDTNITIDNTSYVWMDKELYFDKFGRLDSINGYYYYPTKVTFKEATTSLKGLMSASDKAKLDGIDLTGKQDKLVSGTNIKTINGESILGSGNIVIEGGSGDSSEEVYVWYLDNVSDGTISLQVYEKLKTVKTIIGVINGKFYHASSRFVFRGNLVELTLSTISANVVISYNFSFHEIEDGYDYVSELYLYAIIENYIRVEHGTSDTTFTLTPNTFHVWDEVAALDLSLGDETSGIANEFLFQFTSGATPTTLSLPNLQWANGNEISISANKTYEISITEGLGVWVEFNTL